MLLPVPLTTAACFCVLIKSETASMVARKFAMKVWRCGGEEVLLLHIRAATVARGSENDCTGKQRNMRRGKRR